MKRNSSNSTEALERSTKKKRAASSEPKSGDLDAVSRGRGRKKSPTLTDPNLAAVDDEQDIEVFEGDFEEEETEKAEGENASNEIMAKRRKGVAVSKRKKNNDQDFGFVGKSVPLNEAMKRWPHRYKSARNQAPITNKGVDDGTVKAKCHYLQAKVDGCIYNLYDDAYVKAGEGEADYIGHITEFFESTDKELHFTAQWFFRAEDTVIKNHNVSLDGRRVFLSDETDDNVLDCIVSKVHIAQTMPNGCIPPCDLYYDMSYSPKFSTFANLSQEEKIGNESSSSEIEDCDTNHSKNKPEIESEVALLDLYSGCGAMSTGLCLGAQLSGLNLQTRWAVDLNPHACESLKLNHPKTEVRNEKAEDFLSLLHEWDQLCQRFGVLEENAPVEHDRNSDQVENSDDLPNDPEVFEVERIIGLCYGETENLEKVGLKFKVQWKGYGPEEDTWEPAEGLSDCPERIHEFVQFGYRNNILPLPGRVDVICGGPPCQGVSGFNRFRNVEAPLEDPKNYQLKVFMDIVDFLKPKYVLMENVVDILKFAGGYLGRYALSRLVAMNYQARLGIVAAGSFGLPQFRFRAFLWGACLTKSLPQFPLPTHNVVARGQSPVEFELNVVPFKETQGRQFGRALTLEDAISDLPAVTNDEERDAMDYGNPPKTDFQSSIRRSREGGNWCQNDKLFDHRPLKLKPDDYLRVCEIPKRKGANFRDLAGVLVGPDKVVYLDPNMERVKLPSGKPLVPDYALSFVKGKSLKPFGRLWWDEIIATVVTRAEPHNQALLHPVQDRVLTIREIARLQGFPDYYKLCGPVKERYIQVGNAVAVPVARALGYGLGMAYQGKGGEEATFELPLKFPDIEFFNEDLETVEN